MSWLYEYREIPSEKNGLIKARKLFGLWEVTVQGTGESSSYLTAMWTSAMKRVPIHAPIKRVLMLGLAIGSNLGPLHRRFPNCKVTVIEWDPAMIKLFHEIGESGLPAPEIIEGDATEMIRTLKEPYDLIMADVFTGGDIGAPMRRPDFYDQLARLLKPTGFLLINWYANPELANLLAPHFVEPESWTWRLNNLSLTQPKLPENYVPYRSDPGFLRRESNTIGYRKVVESNGVFGITWGFGPLRFGRFEGDREPSLITTGPRRLIYWQRLTRRTAPPGWSRALISMPTRLTGFVDLSQDPAEGNWTSHARRHLGRWRKQEAFVIKDVDVETFLKGYRRSDLRSSVKSTFGPMLRQKKIDHGERLRFFGVVRVADGKLRGGFVSLDIPESSQSVHIASFVSRDAERAAAGYGLVDRWFHHGREKGLRFMDFDGFWAPGDPSGWKGFSKFKSQFGVTFIRRAPLLSRSMGGSKKTSGV